MATAAQRRGATWERDTRDKLRELGWDYEQLRQTGTNDEGDGVIRLGKGKYLVIEAKNTARMDISGHVNEAVAEAENFQKHRGKSVKSALGVVFQKRRNHGFGKAYAVMQVEDFLRLVEEVQA